MTKEWTLCLLVLTLTGCGKATMMTQTSNHTAASEAASEAMPSKGEPQNRFDFRAATAPGRSFDFGVTKASDGKSTYFDSHSTNVWEGRVGFNTSFDLPADGTVLAAQIWAISSTGTDKSWREPGDDICDQPGPVPDSKTCRSVGAIITVGEEISKLGPADAEVAVLAILTRAFPSETFQVVAAMTTEVTPTGNDETQSIDL